LAEKLQGLIIEKQSKGFNSDTAIIVDDSDIIKPKVKKMEGLKRFVTVVPEALIRMGMTWLT
jgi:hypothetical protein